MSALLRTRVAGLPGFRGEAAPTPSPSTPDDELTLLTTPWNDTDFRAIVCGALELRADPFDWLLALYRESELRPDNTTFVDSAKKYIGIVGMNQFTQEAVVGVFFPKLKGDEAFKAWQAFAWAYRAMTPAEQVPYIVKSLQESAWYRTGKPFPSATPIYMANFLPGKSTLTDPKEVLLYKPAEPCSSPAASSSLYCQNKGMDIDPSDAGITLGDVDAFLHKIEKQTRFQAFRERLSRLMAREPTSVVCPGF